MTGGLNVAAFTALDPELFKDVPRLSLPINFNIQSVDSSLVDHDTNNKPHHPSVQKLVSDKTQRQTPSQQAVLVQTPAPQPLPTEEPAIPGVLGLLKGTFVGSGFNTIFRPSNAKNRAAAEKNPDLAPEVPIVVAKGMIDDNILELNLTIEALVFTPKEIGKVPNRGMDEQPDIILHGVPYVQTIWDVTNPKTGKADDIPRGIHFEPGMFLTVPPTNRPKAEITITRMASIPHGTTINLSGPDATITKGAPPLERLISSTDPNVNFNTSPPSQPKGTFQNMTLATKGTPRLPPDLDLFKKNGTITQELLDEPVTLLLAINNLLKGRISQTHTFTVGSGKISEKINGEIGNIAFLTGNNPNNAPNAHVPFVRSTFWVEIVQYNIDVPPMKAGETKILKPNNLLPGASLPVFCITAPARGISKGGPLTVDSIQVQYAQKVMLKFSPKDSGIPPFDWPHVSVASLVPLAAVPVPVSKLSGMT